VESPESEQQADSALSVLQAQAFAMVNSSILTSAMIVDPSSQIDKFRYEKANPRIDKCQCDPWLA